MVQEIVSTITALAPTFGVGITAYMGYLAAKANSMGKEQFRELDSKLQIISDDVTDVRKLGVENKAGITALAEKVKVHDESHLSVMYLRIEREINVALETGYTNANAFNIISRMYHNYKALGGNGYIDHLFSQYQQLKIKEK